MFLCVSADAMCSYSLLRACGLVTPLMLITITKSRRVFAPLRRARRVVGYVLLLSACMCWTVRTAGGRPAPPVQDATTHDICTENSVHREGKVSHLCAKVTVVDGRPKADPTSTRFFFTEEFLARLSHSKLPRERVQTLLLNRIDRALAQSKQLIYYALTPEERKSLEKGSCQQLSDAGASKLCQRTTSWQNFIGEYDAWRKTRPTAALSQTKPPDFDRLLANADVVKYLDEIKFDSPLDYSDPLKDTAAVDGGVGVLLLRVADPIGDPMNEEYKVCIGEKCDGKRSDNPRTAAAPNDIRRVLRRLRGRLWDRSEIESVVQEFYAGRGLLATVDVGDPFTLPKSVRVKESPRIISLSFSSDLQTSDIAKAVYHLVPDKQFRRFVKCQDELLDAGEGPIKLIVIEMLDLAAKGDCGSPDTDGVERPYLNLLKFQLQKLQLNNVNLDVGVGERTEDGETYVFHQVTKAADAEEKDEETKGENDKATPLANPQGVIDPNLPRPESQNNHAPRVAVQPSLSSTPTPTPTSSGEEGKKKEKKNYVGGGFEYRSGQGVRAIGIYQRDRLLFDNDGVSLKFGGQDEPLGSANYFADYVGFGKLHRRLMLQFTGSSELTANRLFGGVETDERRTGGLARAELELFRDRGGNLLKFSFEAQHTTVELKQKEQTIGKQNLSTLDFGAFYLLQPDYERTYPRWARLEPRLRFGLGLAAGEPRFNAFFMSGNFHQKLPAFFELDFSGRVGLASRNTPLFELPSLGGADSVRGFRQDEAIGRRLWSLQNELWVPVPGTTGSAGEFQRFLLRSVRLTAFADVGRAYQTSGAQPGMRFGPGTGLRFIFNPVVIKLDWAYGLSSAAATTGRGRVSFGLTTNLPF